jgi:hypothetical protein
VMLMLFTGALVIAGVFTFLPGRRSCTTWLSAPDRAARRPPRTS